MDWKRNKKTSPRMVIFVLFNREIADVERSRGMVIKILREKDCLKL